MDELYIGLMSGTSLDGIDAALVNLADGFSCIETLYEPYSPDLRTRLANLVSTQSCHFSDLLETDNQVAIVQTLAVKKLLAKAKLNADRITAIGFHGQTLFHHPLGEYGNTLQIGNPGFVAEHTGITTVSDFRRRDMAVGGQGAPFAPAFHEFLFRKPGIPRVVVNIGGIANITILPGDANQAITGFDTGPGNCLLNDWYAQHHSAQYDAQGSWASTGKCNHTALKTLLADEYFGLPIPKSTGREYFHLNWLARHLNIKELKPEDMQATLLELTCQTIALAINKFARPTQEVYVCGGGVHNELLYATLQKQLAPIKVETTAKIGLDPDWVEACAFAWFAQQTINHKPLKLQSITGAKRNCIAGAIYQ